MRIFSPSRLCGAYVCHGREHACLSLSVIAIATPVSVLCISLIFMCHREHRHGRHGCCHYSGGGLIQLVVLRILYEKPSHGYQIMEQLEQITSEQYTPEPGALYTILRRLEERGLVTSEWEKKEAGADRRVYTLTEDGIQVLKEGLATVKVRSQLMDNLSQFYDKHFSGKAEVSSIGS